MREHVRLCDLCLNDGVRRLAVAVYWNDEGEEWDCCAKHLKDVQGLDLEYKMLSDSGEEQT